jgi:UDP-N-acetylmuramoyl-tripeptide--D-alanyl-D-alanine ligase
VAVLNADDERVRRMASRTAARVTTYGFAVDAAVRAEDIESAGTDGMRFSLVANGARRAASIPTLGRLAVHNALAAAAVGLASGIPLERVADALRAGWSAPHRGALVRAGAVTIVDDSYNASPATVIAALDLLAGLPGRKVAVLGEMLELGDGHEAGHERAGVAAAAVCELLVVVGEGAKGIARGARDAGMDPDRVVEVADRDAAFVAVDARLLPGDVVLVKASRGIELDLLVDALRERLEARLS